MEITPYHVTIKWPAFPGSPEIMVNLHAEDAEELDAQLLTAVPLITHHLADYLAQRREAPAAPAATPEPPEPRPIRDNVEARSRQRAPTPDRRGQWHDYADNGEWNDEEPPEDDARPDIGACGNGHNSWMRSNYDGWFCTADDGNEVGGKCRWVLDKKGKRRKPSRAELDASEAANRRPAGRAR